jgi:hypothetical protein
LGTKSNKVLVASTYLEGPAMEWFEPYVCVWFGEDKLEQDNNITEVFADYGRFVKIITLTFGEVDKKVSVAQKVQQLYQNKLVSKYAAKF